MYVLAIRLTCIQRDEDFDTSYESLLALAQTLGEVKPRSTPAHVINALPTGLYKDWQSPGGDMRCPICLDDVRSCLSFVIRFLTIFIV